MARVLAIDDEPGLLEIFVDVLEADGHVVDTAGGGAAALTRVAAAPSCTSPANLRAVQAAVRAALGA